MSKQDQEIICTNGATSSNVLNNMGGPRSRVRTEEIKNPFFKNKSGILTSELIGLKISEENNDLESWVLGVGRNLNIRSWEAINKQILLPSEKLLVISADNIELELFESTKQDDWSILRSAIILSMCSETHYLPESSRIYTRKRLERKIKLIKIDLNKFYELD